MNNPSAGNQATKEKRRNTKHRYQKVLVRVTLTNGRTDGQADGWADGRAGGRAGGWADRRAGGRADERANPAISRGTDAPLPRPRKKPA